MLLAALLVRRGATVSDDVVVDALWEVPAAGAIGALRADVQPAPPLTGAEPASIGASDAPARYAPSVSNPSDVEARLSALEARMEEVAADATAARHLAAARDRDLADLGVKVDAHRSAISALGQQTAAGFAEMRGTLDQVAAGQQHIADMLTTLISAQGDR